MSLAPPLEKMISAHKLLGEYTYELKPVERGYADRTLYINLSDNTIAEKPVTQQMKDLFTGGRGFALKLLWDAVKSETAWDDPENELVIANGPICGITAYPGSGKATVVTLSPLTHNVIDSNVGGYFAPFLKFSGFDALEIQGKMGRVGSEHDYPPYRAMGPVTVDEYESRQELYDEQLLTIVEVDPAGMSTAEKIAALREYREAQYELLLDAVYKRCGWDENSIPTPEKLKELGIDLPEVLEVVEQARK